ncbi:radical SAM protein [Patescibacteria group bacterium]|nr:radical SAM protein [Patescibacteria group bacterium]MBU1907808.1 radical SAM protein [Patescibacteria group bacterium]
MSDTTRIDGQKLDMHPTRLARWLADKDSWETAKDIFPIYMEISPFGVCNHECTFCSVDYMLDRTDAPRLRFEVLERTLHDMAENGVLSVMFAGAGEPFLYKDPTTKKNLADVILAADTARLDTAITTNSVLMTPERCIKAFEAERLRWIRTSINAGDAETYVKIHNAKQGDFETVLRNLAEAVKIREKLGSGVKLLGQIVVVPETRGRRRRSLMLEDMPSNIHTVVPLAKTLRDIGMDNLAVKPFKQHTVELGETRSSMYQNVSYADSETWERLFNDLGALETDEFEVTIRRQAMRQQETECRGYGTCYSTPYHWAYIEADGEVWGCSAYIGRVENGKEIGDHRFRFGNVNDHLFADIWRGDRRRANWEFTRKPPAEGGLDVSKCMKGCQMDMPNVYLWQLMNPDPNVNFIK